VALVRSALTGQPSEDLSEPGQRRDRARLVVAVDEGEPDLHGKQPGQSQRGPLTWLAWVYLGLAGLLFLINGRRLVALVRSALTGKQPGQSQRGPEAEAQAQQERDAEQRLGRCQEELLAGLFAVQVGLAFVYRNDEARTIATLTWLAWVYLAVDGTRLSSADGSRSVRVPSERSSDG
jgi:hypothetical protein